VQGAAFVYVFILSMDKPTQVHKGQRNFTDVHSDYQAFPGESIPALHHSLPQKAKNTDTHLECAGAETVTIQLLEMFETRLDAVLCSLLWVTLLRQGVGLGDPQRSLPTPNIL